MALPKRLILDRKGGNASAGNVCDLFKAASLLSDDVTCAGVRNDAGHGKLGVGQLPLREVLSKGEGKGDSSRCYCRNALRGLTLVQMLRTPLFGGCGWSCDAGAGLPLEFHDPRQKAADLAAQGNDRGGEGPTSLKQVW